MQLRSANLPTLPFAMLDDLMGFALGTNSAPATVSAKAMAIYKNFRFPVHCTKMNEDALGSGCGAPSRGQREVSLVPHVDVTGIVPAYACRSHPYMLVPGTADGSGLVAPRLPKWMFRFCMMLNSSLPRLVDTSYGCFTACIQAIQAQDYVPARQGIWPVSWVLNEMSLLSSRLLCHRLELAHGLHVLMEGRCSQFIDVFNLIGICCYLTEAPPGERAPQSSFAVGDRMV